MKRNTPFPAGQAIVQTFLKTCPEFAELAASGGAHVIRVLLKAAPATPSKSKALPHLTAVSVKAMNSDDYGILEAGQAKVEDPLFKFTVKEDAWAKLTPRGREAAIYTAMCRCIVTPKDDADSDDTGFTCSVASYPVQTFDRVIEKYGRWDQTDVLYDSESDKGGEDSEDDIGLDNEDEAPRSRKRKAKDLGADAVVTGEAA